MVDVKQIDTRYRLATTATVLANNTLAVLRGYNRQLPIEVVLMLDPEAKHLCYFSMEHFHAQGLPVLRHYRTIWKLFAKGEVLDMQLDWDAHLFECLSVKTAHQIRHEKE